jgi:ATP:ADP antiporter, AAA family
MKDRLFRLLGLESGEESMVIILLSQSVFLGIFFGSFDISAHSLFLAIFDEKIMARGYVVSGITGILLTSLYTGFQTRMRFRNFAIINLLFVTTLTLVLWIILLLNPARWVIFIVFIMLGPLNILAMLGFWGTAGRLFTLRQSKRLFGLVDAGLIIGIIVSCYAIPVLLSLDFNSHNILLISAISIFIAGVIQVIIGKRFSFAAGKGENHNGQKTENKSVLYLFSEDPYIRIMGLFIALSVVTAFFVQYSFMAVTREQYPSETDMARFLGFFTGSMMMFTLLIKILVFSYLIRNYGLKTCLAISPFLIAGFTAIAIGVGMLMGYTPSAHSGFIVFFLLMAVSRLFSKSLKGSIESPSFKVIYQTIDEKIRFEVQSAIDGTVNEIAALSSGMILAGLGILSFVKLIHFSCVLFFITAIWIFAAVRLYAEYRKSIRKALEIVNPAFPDGGTSSVKGVLKNKYSAERTFISDYFRLISGDLSAIENNTSKWYIEKLLDFSGSGHDINLLPALKKVSENKSLDIVIRQRSTEIAENLEAILHSDKYNEEKFIGTRKILAGTRSPQTTEILHLLRDKSLESKRLAIFMIGKFRLSKMLPEVAACLANPGLQADASVVMRSFGTEADKELTKLFMISSGNINTCKMIIRLLGKSCSHENIEFLFSRIWANSRQLKEIAISCLIDCGYKASEEEKDRLHQLISEIVGYMTWNISARICLEKVNDKIILDALNKEISRWNNFLYNVLSITYDSDSISKIRKNLESGTFEGVNFALEMIDIFIDETIKPKLVALLKDVSDEEKVKNLYKFFQGEIPHYIKLADDILNRDYNLLGIWIRASVLRGMAQFENESMAKSVIALLFSPEVILQEESARLLTRSGSTLYRTVSERIPVQTRQKLDVIINGEQNEKDLIFEKVKFLSMHFNNIPEEELLFLAGELIYRYDYETRLGADIKNCIVWVCSNDKPEGEAYIHYERGKPLKDELTVKYGKGFLYLLPFGAIDEFHHQFPETSYEIFNYIEINEEKP